MAGVRGDRELWRCAGSADLDGLVVEGLPEVALEGAAGRADRHRRSRSDSWLVLPRKLQVPALSADKG